jgi:hypothetical protein
MKPNPPILPRSRGGTVPSGAAGNCVASAARARAQAAIAVPYRQLSRIKPPHIRTASGRWDVRFAIHQVVYATQRGDAFADLGDGQACIRMVLDFHRPRGASSCHPGQWGVVARDLRVSGHEPNEAADQPLRTEDLPSNESAA